MSDKTEVTDFQAGVYELKLIEIRGRKEPVWRWLGELDLLLHDANLWHWHLLNRVFFCDQCSYFNENAKAVQDHSRREHDCRCETYYTKDEAGIEHLTLRTVKCHPRPTIKDAPPQKRWREV